MAIQSKKSEWTLKKLLEWTTEYFTKADVDQARLCAEILLAEVMGFQRIELYTNFATCPNDQQLTRYREMVKQCGQHQPVAYLVGKAGFYSLEFKVTPAVLIPRSETEILVTEALNFIERETNRPTVAVLDLCTGSGCVAAAIAANAVECEVVAADVSEDALAVARENIEKHDLTGRVQLCLSDLYKQVETSGTGVFDLIVTNPPYICQADYDQLDPMVKDYEPKAALYGGEDGLDVIRRIITEGDDYLADNGAMMIEVAYNQAQAVKELFENSGYLSDIETVRDDLGHERLVKGKKR